MGRKKDSIKPSSGSGFYKRIITQMHKHFPSWDQPPGYSIHDPVLLEMPWSWKQVDLLCCVLIAYFILPLFHFPYMHKWDSLWRLSAKFYIVPLKAKYLLKNDLSIPLLSFFFLIPPSTSPLCSLPSFSPSSFLPPSLLPGLWPAQSYHFSVVGQMRSPLWRGFQKKLIGSAPSLTSLSVQLSLEHSRIQFGVLS